MRPWWISFLFFSLVGCIENPTSDGKETSLGGAVGGLSQLNPAEAVSLYSPTFSPNTDATPTIQITGLRNGDMVFLYSDTNCSQLIASGNSTGTSLLITIPALSPGTHNFSVKRRWNEADIESPCAQNQLSYQLWNNNLILTGISNDNTPTRSKSWSWGCSGEQSTCEYRFAVTNNSSHTFNNQPYRLIDSAGQTSGTGTYYLHVQARDALHTFLETPVQTYSAILDNTAPSASSLQAPPDATYNLSQSLDFEITFGEAVTISGNPRIELTVGNTARYANYHAGSGGSQIIFRHRPQSGDVDLNGIAFASTQIDFNGGNIQDLAGNQASSDFTSLAISLAGININAAAPQIAGLTNDSIPKKSKTWNWGCNRPSCTYRYSVDQISATVPTGAYVSDTSTDQTNGDGTYYLHIQVRDQSGDESNVQHFSTVLDNTIPTINSILPPSNNTYSEAQAVNFTFNFNEPVNVVGYPQLSLDVSSDTRYARYLSGSGTNAIVLQYLPQNGDSDWDGITFASTNIDLNGGSIKDAAGNDASSDFGATVPNLAGVGIDANKPVINNLNPPTDASYDTSSNLDFELTFNERVSVSGTPRFGLDIGGTTRYANYYSISANGKQLTFRYVPQLGDNDDNGIQFQGTSVQLNGGQIADTAGNSTNLNFPSPPPDLSGITIDTQRAEINGITHPAVAIYSVSQNLNFALTFNRDVNVTGTPRLALLIGGQIRHAEYESTLSSSTNLTFVYTTQSGDNDGDGITFFNSTIDLNAGTINDTRGYAALLSFTSVVPDLSGVIIDSVLPAPTGIANDSVYKKNKNWAWGCSKQNCNYRSVVNTNPSSVLTAPYGTTTSAAQLGGDGTYYLHVQVLDSQNNESQVHHFSAELDNTAPNFSGTVDISNDSVTTTQAPSVDWSATASSDALSGVAKIEVAIGYDVTDDGVDPSDRNNIVDWREIPNGISFNLGYYKIQNGVDGFSLDLTNDVDYFTSLRLEDAAGNKSVELTSDPWGLFDPRRVEGLELWLDGQDLSTLFKDELCTNNNVTGGSAIGCWQDKSGGNHHAVQSDYNRRPVYQVGGHIGFNYQSRMLNAGNVLSGNYDELSVFIVFRQVANPSYNWPVAFNLNWDSNDSNCGSSNGPGRISAHIFERNTDNLYWDFGGCTSDRRLSVSANAQMQTRNFYHLGGSTIDNSLFIRKNGSELASRNISLTVYINSSSQVIVGNGQSATANAASPAQIGEFIVYSEHISTTNREKLEGYLACKWNLQTELPNTHPYATNCP